MHVIICSLFFTWLHTLNSVNAAECSMDLVFVFDGSRSMSESEFEENKDFILDVMKTFNDSNAPIEFAAVQFSSGFRTVFDFNDYRMGRAPEYLKREKQMKSLTNTHGALTFVLGNIFLNQTAGASPDAVKYVVVIADGNPIDKDKGILQTYDDRNIIRLVIRVKYASLRVLEAIASEPRRNNIFKIEDYNGLTGILKDIERRISNNTSAQPSCRNNCGYNLERCSCSSNCRDYRNCCCDYNTHCHCGGSLYGNGTFSSPNYPGQYYNNANCIWKLTADYSQTVSLSITDLQLENCCDWIDIYDGPSEDYPHLGKVSQNISTSQSSWEYMTVRFRTDGSGVGSGFHAEFSSISHISKALQVQPTVKTTESDLRLVGGTSHCTGSLEIKHLIEWRPAADLMSTWNLESSSVVCKQINCGSAVDSKWSLSERQPVWWITSSCDGSESTLSECGTMQPGQSGDRLMVICSDSPAIISVSVDPPGEVVEGSKVTLTCSSDANPPVDYTWYRDSRYISTGPQLVKGNVTSADSGNYTCQATNTQRSSPHHLDVQYGPKKVLLAVSPPGDFVKGSTVTFTCSSSESNPPFQSYFILKDNKDVAQKAIFTISNIQSSDSGTYYCQAMNNIATVSSPRVSLDLHPVRLVGGTSHCVGTLEVKHRNEWRPVADPLSNWNLTSSSVVCKQIDCGSAAVTRGSHGSERQPVWLITSSCDGSESTPSECGMQRAISMDRLEVICSALFSKCGKPDPPDTVKVVRGRPSRPGDHPWQVSLQRRTKGSSEPFKHACGGVLIASCWVLTAGHCINSSKEMQVVVGRLDHTEHGQHDQIIPVEKDIIHGSYRPSKLSNDIALLQLKAIHSPLCAVESRYVKTACLPNQLFPDDKECVISGWGRTREENKKSSKLFDAHIPLISKQSCEDAYPDRLDLTMICAGDIERGVDACRGDSGGPLMCKQNGTHYLAGLVSWGTATCGEANKPGVYTNVHFYVDWINKTMSGDEDYDYNYEFKN